MPECQDIITSEEYGDFIWEIAENPDLTIGQLARMTGYSEELLKCKNIFMDNTP